MPRAVITAASMQMHVETVEDLTLVAAQTKLPVTLTHWQIVMTAHVPLTIVLDAQMKQLVITILTPI